MATGPGITPGSSLPEGQAIDIGPTILELMGAPIPEYCDGKPLIEKSITRLATHELSLST
jgi:arylsulfatase A-like enzyme